MCNVEGVTASDKTTKKDHPTLQFLSLYMECLSYLLVHCFDFTALKIHSYQPSFQPQQATLYAFCPAPKLAKRLQ